MAKKPSQSRADYQEQNNGESDMRLDPLIDALLEHLPAPGEPFPPERRQLWMQILELSLKLIYDENQEAEQGDGQQT